MSIKKLLYKKQYTHLKVLQLRYCGRDSIIQVRTDLIFIMVPLGEQKQMEVVQTYKTSCRYVTYSRFGQFVSNNKRIYRHFVLVICFCKERPY